MIRSVCAALALALVAAAPAAAAPPKAIGSYAYFEATPGDEDYAGRTVVVFRTDRALPAGPNGDAQTRARLFGFLNYPLTISRGLHCYELRTVVGRGRNAKGRAGDPVRARVGRDGVTLDRRLTIRRATDRRRRGRALGCGADPASRAVFFNLFDSPKSEPGQIFLTANSGPYIEDITWTGWGTATATGAGTYVSECASCGEPQRYAVTIVADRLIACRPYSAKAYNHWTFERTGGAAPTDPTGRDFEGEAEIYC